MTDEQVIRFITRGYLVLENDLPPSFHQSILDSIAYRFAEEGNPGNNILPSVPQLEKCFNTPVVQGALTSILGDNYYMHPHRHCHYNQPGQAVAQGWHKDGYWSSMRSHRPWWAIVFYYTQDITEEMGPTEIMPGSQYYEKYAGEDMETGLPYGKAGTMVLVHFDMWHRASLNRTNIDRYMLKFQFVRLEQPAYPTWNHQNPELIVPEDAISLYDHRPIWNDVWNWMLGQGNERRGGTAIAVQEHTAILQGDDEPAALNAAYTLGQMGTEGAAALLAVMRDGEEAAALRAAYGVSTAGQDAVPGLIEALKTENDRRAGYAAFALGMQGHTAHLAVPALIESLDHSSKWVRRNAVEALGMIRQPANEVIPALIRALSIEDEDGSADKRADNQRYILHKVRYAAALSLLRIGQESAARAAVAALRDALEDEDRYVRAYASEALTFIKSDEAVETLIAFFRKSRWCSSTNKSSTF
ncbi:HEAT repeat domain-containing protein [Paenibacillus mendelii]|nr:HEAT repeat domain-containing protein [Paenibacillus mendelii]